jgi:hypothetical protein
MFCSGPLSQVRRFAVSPTSLSRTMTSLVDCGHPPRGPSRLTDGPGHEEPVKISVPRYSWLRPAAGQVAAPVQCLRLLWVPAHKWHSFGTFGRIPLFGETRATLLMTTGSLVRLGSQSSIWTETPTPLYPTATDLIRAFWLKSWMLPDNVHLPAVVTPSPVGSPAPGRAVPTPATPEPEYPERLDESDRLPPAIAVSAELVWLFR